MTPRLHLRRALVLCGAALALAACRGSEEDGATSTGAIASKTDPSTWSSPEDLRPAKGGYALRSLIEPGSLAKCPLFAQITIAEGAYVADGLRFEEQPLYYELDPAYQKDLRLGEQTGLLSELWSKSWHGSTPDHGVLRGPSSPYMAEHGTSTLAFYEKNGALFVRYSVDDPDYARYPQLVCEYERAADTVMKIAPSVIKSVRAVWTATKDSVGKLTDAQVDALCKSLTDGRYFYRNPWADGLCDAADSATNRTNMVAALDGALKSLAKEEKGLTNPKGAYGDVTYGEERLEVGTGRNAYAAFNGMAPTELYPLEVEQDIKKDRCEDLGLTIDECKLNATIYSAFTTRYQDRVPEKE